MLGGSLLPLSLTAIVLCYLGLLRYEWSHFLIHTPYVPRSQWYRAIWRNHRLRVLGTNPDHRTVPKSPTARTLGIETE